MDALDQAAVGAVTRRNTLNGSAQHVVTTAAARAVSQPDVDGGTRRSSDASGPTYSTMKSEPSVAPRIHTIAPSPSRPTRQSGRPPVTLHNDEKHLAEDQRRDGDAARCLRRARAELDQVEAQHADGERETTREKPDERAATEEVGLATARRASHQILRRGVRLEHEGGGGMHDEPGR